MAHDVFISHSTSDRAVADAMCSRLEQVGVRCWIAPRGEESNTPAGLAKLKAAGYDPSNWAVIEGTNDGNVFTAAVGSFRPNGLGIYDLGGNVREWCQDEYEPGSASRVLRGGSWFYDYRGYLLSSSRIFGVPDYRNVFIGFRVVVEAGSER